VARETSPGRASRSSACRGGRWAARSGARQAGRVRLGYEDEDAARRRPRRARLIATRASWCGANSTGRRGLSRPAHEQAERLQLEEELVAPLVGRWRDGSPLVLRPDAPDPALGNDKQRANDFRYGDDPLGRSCPRGAHVRRTNPRDALGWEGRLTARHRILRRGMPYGPALAEGAADDGVARGLLFVCLQASIARQFEIVQTQWCNDGNAFGLGREADPITGPAGGEVRHIIEGEPPRVASPLRTYVECRGGEYLVVPAISACARCRGYRASAAPALVCRVGCKRDQRRVPPGWRAPSSLARRRIAPGPVSRGTAAPGTPFHVKSRPGSDPPLRMPMTSRNMHRLVLILLTE
jgi:Dyp-type peroxidase family